MAVAHLGHDVAPIVWLGALATARNRRFPRIRANSPEYFGCNRRFLRRILVPSNMAAAWKKRVHDTMIAGIVLAHNATIATRNTKDFDDISASVVNPWAA
jgi:hypothetical protein